MNTNVNANTPVTSNTKSTTRARRVTTDLVVLVAAPFPFAPEGGELCIRSSFLAARFEESRGSL
jgi:hypothetical protein